MQPNPNPNEPVINEIRELRRRISARFDHDPARLVAHYLELQKLYKDRVVASPTTRNSKDPSAA